MSAVTNIKAFDTPKKLKVSEIEWAKRLWEPLKDHLLSRINIKMSIPKDKPYCHINSGIIKGAIYSVLYSVRTGEACVSYETFGGEETKSIVEGKIANAPEGHVIKSAVISQGKKNKDKWSWTMSLNIDKSDSNLLNWYAETFMAFYLLIEDK